MNCDRIAPFYRFFETAAFGGKLQRYRVAFLNAAENQERALVLGDGDGRFSEALAATYPRLEIDYIEISAGMLTEARKRLSSKSQVRLIQADALNVSLARGHYGVVFTHFFLDCFDQVTIEALARALSTAMAHNAVWIISDFKQANSGWRKAYTRLWLGAMYFFFRQITGLETRKLANYDAALDAMGFSLRRAELSRSGLIASEWWQR